MVDAVSISSAPSAPATTGASAQSRTAALETAFPGLRVVGATPDTAQQQKQDRKTGIGGGQKPALATGDTLLAAQQQGDAGSKLPGDLSDEEKQQIAKLKQIDAKVRAHERAHAAVGGQYAGAPSYSYTRGPDGQQYAVGGEVSISVGPERDPEATLQKAAQVQAAALAPADPSGQDRAVAAAAAQLRIQALQQISEEKRAEAEQQQAERDAARAEAEQRQQALQGSGGPAPAKSEDSEVSSTAGQSSAAGPSLPAAPAGTAGQNPAARAAGAYANDNAGLNRLVGQVVGISA